MYAFYSQGGNVCKTSDVVAINPEKVRKNRD